MMTTYTRFSHHTWSNAVHELVSKTDSSFQNFLLTILFSHRVHCPALTLHISQLQYGCVQLHANRACVEPVWYLISEMRYSVQNWYLTGKNTHKFNLHCSIYHTSHCKQAVKGQAILQLKKEEKCHQQSNDYNMLYWLSTIWHLLTSYMMELHRLYKTRGINAFENKLVLTVNNSLNLYYIICISKVSSK